jgi:malonate-semialdehyde dehydrogenase (acetylating) / methylmalonate-semialdehyde dehydrogenase
MEILNYINGEWVKPNVTEYFDVINPATGQVIAKTPLSTKADVDAAAKAASEAFVSWRRTPVNDRVQYLFKLRNIMREHGDEIAKLITDECGKTFEEAKAEMVRASKMWKLPAACRHLEGRNCRRHCARHRRDS